MGDVALSISPGMFSVGGAFMGCGIHLVGIILTDTASPSVSEVIHVRNGCKRDSRWGRVENRMNSAEVHGVLPVPLV
jgi:hypothetical protein